MTAVERINLEPAFVLHGRAYRETSEILDLLTRNHGRISLVARGMRTAKAGLRAVLQPFQPVAVSWTGRGGSLMNLRAAEAAGRAGSLRGTALMSAYYVNELILRFLHKGDPHPQLFGSYAEVIHRLGVGEPADVVLRRFEMELLSQTGYGLNLEFDAVSGEPLVPSGCYQYVVERGAVPAEPGVEASLVYSGAELLAIGRSAFDDGIHLACARRLLRAVLDHHLGGKPLRTRQVFAAMRR